MFLLASTSSMVTGRWVHQDTCPRFCHSPGGLLHVLAGALRSVTDRLQRVLNAAARVVSGTRKYDRGLSQLLYLHWLNVADRVQFKLAKSCHHSLPGAKVPDRLLCRCLRYRWSSETVLRTLLPTGCTAHQQTTLGRRPFSVAGPTVWNSLPDELRDETENTYWQS